MEERDVGNAAPVQPVYEEHKRKATSNNEATVSGYATVNSSSDSMTVVLVNRDLSASRTATVNLTGFAVSNGSYKILELSSLPAGETFVSRTSNALKSKTVVVSGNSFNITLPSLSTTAVILKGTAVGIDEDQHDLSGSGSLSVFPTRHRENLKFILMIRYQELLH